MPPVFSKKCNSTLFISVFGRVPASCSALSLNRVESKVFDLLKDLSYKKCSCFTLEEWDRDVKAGFNACTTLYNSSLLDLIALIKHFIIHKKKDNFEANSFMRYTL